MHQRKRRSVGPQQPLQVDKRADILILSRDDALLDKQTRMTVAGIAFGIFLVAHLLGAVYSPIQDCDEVFNFWEPTHYLNHGSGLQTWELSPEYAIRSWLYITIHAIPTACFSFLTSAESKVAQFYALRCSLAVFCALCEARLFAAISRWFNPRIATFYLLASVTSAGMFHAATSYLSSTFAMYSVILALGSFLDWQGGKQTAQGLTYLAIGTILGWPFVAVLCLPFVFEDFLMAVFDSDLIAFAQRMISGLSSSIGVLLVEVIMDSAYIHRLTSVPLNIVLYNVLSDDSRGPDLYGTEPWHFYPRNLVLNFNIWFLLALGSAPLILLHHITSARVPSPRSLLAKRTLLLSTPFYLWLAVFLAQPHKEERFMYPIYPCIALNASIALHVLLIWLGHLPVLPASFKLAITIGLLMVAAAAGVLRSILLATAYRAPLSIYEPLARPGGIIPGHVNNVCIGKEWYRFPSSYHLPAPARLRFLPSEFRGLLPGPFAEHNVRSYETNLERLVDLPHFFTSRRPGTFVTPDAMNDLNLEDPGKYSSIDECDYIIDSRLPSWTPTLKEPDWIGEAKAGKGEWEVVKCEAFMDSERTSTLRRTIWLPQRLAGSSWGDYCLLQRKAKRSTV